jgi:capsular polysaccharide transport system ATP-binding protein
MIVFDEVTATIGLHSHKLSAYAPKRHVLSSVSLTIPSDRRIALIGEPGDKRILINLISGLTQPVAGRITRAVKVSFPVGYLGSFDLDLPVRHNVAHVARLYDTNADMMVTFIERAGRFGPSFEKPYRQLSQQMKARLGYIVAYCIPFDVYVMNDGGVRAAANPRDVLHALFQERCRTSGMIVSTRNPKFAQEFCEMAMLINNGELQLYDNVEKALTASRRGMAIARRMRGLPQRKAD